MNKSTLFIFLVLIALLAGLSSYFYAKDRTIEQGRENNNTDTTSLPNVSKTQTSENPTTSPSVTKAPTMVISTNRPSNPAEIYQIGQGETLFSIGSKFNLDWNSIAQANGITDVNKILAEQKLVIPKVDNKGLVVEYKVDENKAKELQAKVDKGQDKFRLDPTQTVQNDIGGVFGLTKTEQFQEKSKDLETGKATVTSKKQDKEYEIILIQPVTKGENGIWSIDQVRD